MSCDGSEVIRVGEVPKLGFCVRNIPFRPLITYVSQKRLLLRLQAAPR